VLVSVMYDKNEIGTIQPLSEISHIIAKRRAARQDRPLYFHTDACQAANYLDLHVARLGVDLMTLNGGKIYGPKQSGALFVSSSVQLKPIILGGGQERNLRSGTQNVAACIGFATALTAVQTDRHTETKRLQELQRYFCSELVVKLPQVILNGSRKRRLPNNVHVTIPGEDNERILIQLDEAGILAAAGSACSASDEEPSHVLRAIGLEDSDAQASLRFTMGRMTKQADVALVIAALSQFVTPS
jgi:cysteine desulfurase